VVASPFPPRERGFPIFSLKIGSQACSPFFFWVWLIPDLPSRIRRVFCFLESESSAPARISPPLRNCFPSIIGLSPEVPLFPSVPLSLALGNPPVSCLQARPFQIAFPRALQGDRTLRKVRHSNYCGRLFPARKQFDSLPPSRPLEI